ncbi:uncharacterized protein LOC128732122 [Anopheles nili]|uniref:uncharacterized protein LOC128732122 n=1 Tax=Anopheles nili TaxID=185578 RepID=UPI00237B9CAB|nr:uncharacterized protein LOC128732122 [Anopheles nili]
MTKKKPSPQNRIWEKERRERLNKTFEDLQRLLPDNEPTSTLSKVEILQRAIELIGKLQKKIKDLVEVCNDPLKEHVKEQEHRLKRLLARNEELADLLRKAKINIPPCKYTIVEEELQRENEEKENGNRHKKAEPKQRRSGASPKKQPVIQKKPPPGEAVSEGLAISAGNSISTTNSTECGVVSSSYSSNIQSTPCPSALRHINGTGGGNNVNVTPALLPTPIMTTSVLISNNGNLVQVPIVAPPSSLLIVGNEDVRAKINLKNPPLDGAPSRFRGRRGKFAIKSIDLIPGRIVNGKIPIPPLRRSMNEASKIPRLKRKKSLEKFKKPRRASLEAKKQKNDGPPNAKYAKLETVEKHSNESQLNSNQPQPKGHEGPFVTEANHPCAGSDNTNNVPKERQTNVVPIVNEQHETHMDINLNHTDLSEDIFANLQVPDENNTHGNNDDGTLSPTAAYLMNFPLVAGGGKAAANHVEAGETDECHDGTTTDQHISKTDPSVNLQTIGGTDSGNMLLDNFSSFFNYGHIDAMGGTNASSVLPDISSLPPLPASTTSAAMVPTTTITTVASSAKDNGGFSNFPTIYQSIDNMLEHRPAPINRPVIGSGNRSLAPEPDFSDCGTFTFTLTSSTCTAPTTVQSTIAANHYYGGTCGPLNPVKSVVVDDFSTPLKPSIEFTFSLTSTTASQPRTVQSQYTNSTILATTMTTPSYDTYGYYHKNVSKPSNYCASFNVLDPLLATEKPATSFTFSLTSSTKTEPSYAQSSLVTVSTNTTQTCEAAPKLATKHHQPTQPLVGCVQPKQESVQKTVKATYKPAGASTSYDTLPNALPQQNQLQSHQQTSSSVASSTNQHPSKYDVSWMAAGTHNGHSVSSSQSNQQQQQQQQMYDLVQPQIIPSLDFPPATGYASSNNYKSDIFFAHPPGEDHNLTWSSPSKLSNILNDSSSPYFPPVTLPNLNGDLALNTSGSGSALGAGGNNTTNRSSTTVASCKIASNHSKKNPSGTSIAQSGAGAVQNESTTGSSFLSVSQLVNEPSKSVSCNSNIAAGSGGNSSCQQKPVNNNYSAEALISNTHNSQSAHSSVGYDNGRKDKLFDYGSAPLDGVAPCTSSALTFNFDTYGSSCGMDYNKGYNFGNQQNGYVSSFGETGYTVPLGASSCVGSNTAGSSGLPYYGKTASSQAYYNQPSSGGMLAETSSTTVANSTHPQPAAGCAPVAQDFTPYYLSSFAEKCLPGKQYHPASQITSSEQSVLKPRKGHKSNPVVPVVDYVFPPPVTSATVATGTLNASSNYSYTTIGNVPNTPTLGTTGSTTQIDPLAYGNYHPHSHHHHHHNLEQPQQRVSNQQYGEVASESFNTHSSGTTPRKATTSSSSYNYVQYSSSAAGFNSAKTEKPLTQTVHHHSGHHHQQSGYTPAAGNNSHHLDLSSCINTAPAAGFANLEPASVPQSSVIHAQTPVSHNAHHYRELQSHQQGHHNHHHHQYQQPHSQHPQHSDALQSSNSAIATTAGNGSASNSATGSSGTITNFNLSTICPEINEKTGRSRDGPAAAGPPTVAPSSVASIMTHW